MAATSAGALKQLIEGLGLGLMAYRKKAASDATYPFVVITDGITNTTIPLGDAGDADVEIENVQVDLWEQYIDEATGKVVESDELKRALKRGMHKATIDGPSQVYGVRVPFNTSTTNADDNTVRTRYSVNIHRDF